MRNSAATIVAQALVPAASRLVSTLVFGFRTSAGTSAGAADWESAPRFMGARPGGRVGRCGTTDRPQMPARECRLDGAVRARVCGTRRTTHQDRATADLRFFCEDVYRIRGRRGGSL